MVPCNGLWMKRAKGKSRPLGMASIGKRKNASEPQNSSKFHRAGNALKHHHMSYVITPLKKKTWFSVTSIRWEYAKYIILEYCRFPHLRLKSVDSLGGRIPGNPPKHHEVKVKVMRLFEMSRKKGSQTSKVLPMGKVPRNVGMHLRTLMHRNVTLKKLETSWDLKKASRLVTGSRVVK